MSNWEAILWLFKTAGLEEFTWPIIVLIVAALGCVCPWDLTDKTECTKDKNGNKIKKHYHWRY